MSDTSEYPDYKKYSKLIDPKLKKQLINALMDLEDWHKEVSKGNTDVDPAELTKKQFIGWLTDTIYLVM